MSNKIKKGLIGGLVLALIGGTATFVINKIKAGKQATSKEEITDPKEAPEKVDFSTMTVEEYIEKYGKPDVTKVLILKDGKEVYYVGDPNNIVGQEDVKEMRDPTEEDIRNAVQEHLNELNHANAD